MLSYHVWLLSYYYVREVVENQVYFIANISFIILVIQTADNISVDDLYEFPNINQKVQESNVNTYEPPTSKRLHETVHVYENVSTLKRGCP